MSNIIIFVSDNQPVEVRLESESVWLNLQQLADLFGRDKSVISRHLKNIFDTNELSRISVVAKNATTAADGKTYQVDYYNLDAIISVGYRVNSLQATRFRQWATRILRDHLTRGYSLNEYRLNQQGLGDLEQAISLLGKTLSQQALVNDIGKEVLGLILGYAKTWRLLLDYDEEKLAIPAGSQPARGVLAYTQARDALDALAAELRQRGEASDLFARDRADGLASILGNIEQSMFGEPLYKTREERAAHLLYFIIKNHPFSDGNKRSGAFLFLLYCRQENIRLTMDENGLTALTLLIAESDPKAKDLMVRLVVNLLVLHSRERQV